MMFCFAALLEYGALLAMLRRSTPKVKIIFTCVAATKNYSQEVGGWCVFIDIRKLNQFVRFEVEEVKPS